MGLLVVGLTVLGGAYVSFGQSDAGWTTLIDGVKGLDNWNRVGDANWRGEDGAIVADKGKGGFLVSKNSYGSNKLTVAIHQGNDQLHEHVVIALGMAGRGADGAYNKPCDDSKQSPPARPSKNPATAEVLAPKSTPMRPISLR
jgi:hypothetical protein